MKTGYAVLLVLLGVFLADVIVGDAQQVRINDTIVGSSGASGLVKDGDSYSFRLPGTQVVAPMYIGMITPPRLEPTSPAQSGAVWLYCKGEANQLTCGLRVNVVGNVLEVGSSTWALN